MSRDELLKGIDFKNLEKVNKCKNNQELLELAKEEGVELTDEQLEAVSGGFCEKAVKECPSCHQTNICLASNRQGSDCGSTLYYCRDCQIYWFYE